MFKWRNYVLARGIMAVEGKVDALTDAVNNLGYLINGADYKGGVYTERGGFEPHSLAVSAYPTGLGASLQARADSNRDNAGDLFPELHSHGDGITAAVWHLGAECAPVVFTPYGYLKESETK